MKRDIKKDKLIRFIMRCLFVVFAFIAPVVLVSLRYEIVSEYSGWKISIVGMIVLISIIYRFKNRVLQWINSWEYSVLKHILLGFSKIALFAVLVGIAHIAKREASSVVFVLDWYLVLNVIAYIVILPIEEHYDYFIKREIRKTELREVIHE